jgi:hypothetical protein
MRTTIDLDEPVLRDLKRLQKSEAKSLGRLVSDLLAPALAARRAGADARPAFVWEAAPMQAKVDIADRDALLDAMHAGHESGKAAP